MIHDTPSLEDLRLCQYHQQLFQHDIPLLNVLTAHGEVHGVLLTAPRGEGGFGYDPIFYVPELGVTTAEMTMEDKNKISHRGRALRELREKLNAYLEQNGGKQ